MGLFNKQQIDPVYQDDAAAVSAQPPAQAQGSIDGVIQSQDTSVSSPPADNSFLSQTAPPLDSQTEDAGGYIMADPPAPQTQTLDASSQVQPEDSSDTAVTDHKVMEPAYPSEPAPVEKPDNTVAEPSTPSDNTVAADGTSLAAQTHVPVATSNDDSDLSAIRQEALKQLSPLVTHLDQSPEEKFQTAMMMLQATDDQTLVKTAYEAAKAIPDEKAKARALLDIVNEINYFTQQKSD